MSEHEVRAEHDEGMSLIEHLAELRRRLVYVLLVLAVAFIGSFSFAPNIFDWLRTPLQDIPYQSLVVLSPLEMFITYMKLAFVASIFISAPWLLFQIWQFIAPGLYANEKKWIAPFVIFGTLFFVGGGAFAFYIVLPLGFEYLVQMVPQEVNTTYSVAIYYSLVVRLILAFGVVFELPLAMWILAAAGMVTPQAMASVRKYWIIIAFLIAALLTPPDPFTQGLMAIPLIVFFELGILGAKILYRKRAAQAETARQDEK